MNPRQTPALSERINNSQIAPSKHELDTLAGSSALSDARQGYLNSLETLSNLEALHTLVGAANCGGNDAIDIDVSIQTFLRNNSFEKEHMITPWPAKFEQL